MSEDAECKAARSDDANAAIGVFGHSLVRALVQRVSRAQVQVDGRVTGAIASGVVVLLGVTGDDDDGAVRWMARKIAGLRIFPGPAGRMSLGLQESGGAVLLVPQFTLYGDVRRGRRPDFTRAARPEQAAPRVEQVAGELERLGLRVERGVFGAHMEVELVNDGPVTLMIESPPAATDEGDEE